MSDSCHNCPQRDCLPGFNEWGIYIVERQNECDCLVFVETFKSQMKVCMCLIQRLWKSMKNNVLPAFPGMPIPPIITTVTTDVYLTLIISQNICRILSFLSNKKEKCMNWADVPIEDWFSHSWKHYIWRLYFCEVISKTTSWALFSLSASLQLTPGQFSSFKDWLQILAFPYLSVYPFDFHTPHVV